MAEISADPDFRTESEPCIEAPDRLVATALMLWAAFTLGVFQSAGA